MNVEPFAGRIRVRTRIALSLFAIATLATLLTLYLPRHRLTADLRTASEERLDRATAATRSLIEDVQQRVLERHRAIARTPEFRANLETADVATLHALAGALVEREASVDAVVFTNSLDGFVAAAGSPALQRGVASIEWAPPSGPHRCDSHPGTAPCREVVGEGESRLLTSRDELVIASSIPLFTRGRFIGRASFLETQERSILAHWAELAGAQVVLAPSDRPIEAFERVAATLPPLEIRVQGSFAAERAALDQLEATILSAGLIALLIAFSVTSPLTRSLIAPLAEIESAAHRIRNGDHSIRLHSDRADEFGDVANALDTMLDHLDAMQAGLERAQKIGGLGGWRLVVGEHELVVTRQLEEILDLQADDGRISLDRVLRRIDPKDRTRFASALAECTDRGHTIGLDHHLICADGSERIVHTRAERIEREDGLLLVEGTIQDISERKRDEERIRVLAYHDVLTGLGNRRNFAEELESALAHGREHLTPLAVLFLDLDDFKTVNDTLGHGVGDQLLCLVADRLRHVVAELEPQAGKASVHRLGGDEFALILSDLKDLVVVEACAGALLRELSGPVEFNGYEVQVSASVGIATWPDEGLDLDSLLLGCDTAMYHAKVEGRGRYRFYEPTMREASERRLRLESGIRRAIDQEEFSIVYQPKVDPKDGRVVGFEALMRWRDQELGAVSPEEFVAVAEETGQILALGEWVIQRVATQARGWLDSGVGPLPIAVNISSLQIESDTLLDAVVDALRETGLPPGQLELEVTESALLRNETRAIETLGELKRSGVKLSLDDFGTGYSSLSYLRRLPIDTVKIDRCFVRDIAHNEQDRLFVSSILSMADLLGLDVVVEGVEDAAQCEALRAMGCSMIQGYYFSPGVQAEDVPGLVETGFPPKRD